MTCKELVELITDYLEGAMSPEQRARFEAHLTECEGCSIYLEQMKTTVTLLGGLTEQNIDPHAGNELLKVFRDWKQDRV